MSAPTLESIIEQIDRLSEEELDEVRVHLGLTRLLSNSKTYDDTSDNESSISVSETEEMDKEEKRKE